MKEKTEDRVVERVRDVYIPMLNRSTLPNDLCLFNYSWSLVMFWFECPTPDDEETGEETDWLCMTDLGGLSDNPAPNPKPPVSTEGLQMRDYLLSDEERSGWILLRHRSEWGEEFAELHEDALWGTAVQLANLVVSDLMTLGMTGGEFVQIAERASEEWNDD